MVHQQMRLVPFAVHQIRPKAMPRTGSNGRSSRLRRLNSGRAEYVIWGIAGAEQDAYALLTG